MAKDRIVLPGLPRSDARVLIDEITRIKDELATLKRKPGRAGIVTSDYSAKAGEFVNIEARSGTLVTITLPESTPALRGARITLAFRNSNQVRVVAVQGTVNGESFVINDRPGTYDAVADGLGGWAVQVGVSEEGSGAGGSPDAEYVVGAADASLPNARVATDSTEVDAVLTTPNVISWVLNVASVAFSKLADMAGLSVLGRASSSSGAMAAITATDGYQRLVSSTDGTSIGWESYIPALHTQSASGTVSSLPLPSGMKTGDYLTLQSSGGITLTGIQNTVDGVAVPIGFEFQLGYANTSGSGAVMRIQDGSGTNLIGTPGDEDIVMPTGSRLFVRRATSQWVVNFVGAQVWVRDNGSAETPRNYMNFVSSTSVSLAVAPDSTNNEVEITAQRAALTGFAAASANSNATTSAEPIITYAASSNMSAERVATDTTTVDVDIGTAGQVRWNVQLSATYAWTGGHSWNTAGDFDATAATVGLNSNATFDVTAVGNATIQSDADVALTGDTVRVRSNGTGGFLTFDAASASTPSLVANEGMFWVEDPGSAPTMPRYTDDANTDHYVSTGLSWQLGTGVLHLTLAADADDLGIGHVTLVRLAGNGFRLTGMVPAFPGQAVLIMNADTVDNLILGHEDTASAAANRFSLPNLTDYTIPPRGMVLAFYDDTSEGWFIVGSL